MTVKKLYPMAELKKIYLQYIIGKKKKKKWPENKWKNL